MNLILRTFLIIFFLFQYSLVQCQGLYGEGIFLAKVEQAGKEGYINNFGEVVIPTNFDEVGKVNEGKINARSGDNWFTYDLNGKLLLDLGKEYKWVGVWGSALCLVSDDIKYMSSEPNNRKKAYLGHEDFRFIDTLGNVVLELPKELKLSYEFAKFIKFDEDVLTLSIPEKRTSTKKLIGYMNKSSEIIHPITIPGSYYNADFQEGRALVPSMHWSQENLDDVKYGFISKEGKLHIDSIYNLATSFIDGVSIATSCYTLPAKNENSKAKEKCESFIIDKYGGRLFGDSVFTDLNTKPIDSTFFVFKQMDRKKKYALAHSSGKLLTEFKFDHVVEPVQGGYYIVKIYGEDSQFMNSLGKIIKFENLLSNFRNFTYGMLITNENKLYRIFDMDNNIIFEKELKHRPFIINGILKIKISNPNDPNEIQYEYYGPYGKKLDVDQYDNKLRFNWYPVN